MRLLNSLLLGWVGGIIYVGEQFLLKIYAHRRTEMVGKEVRPLRYCVQKVLPLVYDDSLSYYELLDKVVYKLNEVVASNDELVEYVGPFSDKISEIEKELKDLLNGDYVEMIQRYLTEAIKHVYFGLTNSGYFAAYIPDNWSNIQFTTIQDYDSELYGHLVLMYD